MYFSMMPEKKRGTNLPRINYGAISVTVKSAISYEILPGMCINGGVRITKIFPVCILALEMQLANHICAIKRKYDDDH
jgi:hypothetical protein